MSNPTELPDLDKLEALAKAAQVSILRMGMHGRPKDYFALLDAMPPETVLALIQLARRAQPEGEAPQADPEQPNGGMHDSIFVKVWGDAGGGDAGRRKLAEYAYALGKRASATFSPLCGAQHAESGKEVAAKPPFPISDDEMAALRRFWECATDGEGYDVEKSMMQRLADMGLVQRKSGSYYMSTDFGLYVLGEYTIDRAAQLDGGQEGSESNG